MYIIEKNSTKKIKLKRKNNKKFAKTTSLYKKFCFFTMIEYYMYLHSRLIVKISRIKLN